MKTAYIVEGTRIERKRDGAIATVVNRTREQVRPYGVFRTLLTIRLDDDELRAQVGGDQTGELSWLVSNFRVI